MQPTFDRAVDMVTIALCVVGACGNSWFMYRTLDHWCRQIHLHVSKHKPLITLLAPVRPGRTIGDRQVNAQRLCLLILSLIGLVDRFASVIRFRNSL